MSEDRAERMRQRASKGRTKEARWSMARTLTDAIARLVQQRDAGLIDEAQYAAKARGLLDAVPDEVVRTARRINKEARDVLRADESEGEKPSADPA